MRYLPYLTLSLFLLGSSCGSKKQETVVAAESIALDDVAANAAPPAEAEAAPEGSTVHYTPPVVSPDATAPVVASTPRLLIYHAELRLKVESLAQAAPRLDSLVRRSGGHLSASTETREDGEWRQETTIRVQPGRLIDWLLSGSFELMGSHADWQPLIGRPLTAVQVGQNEVRLTFGMREVFIVTAQIDQLSGQIEGRTDNLVVFFDANQRQAF